MITFSEAKALDINAQTLGTTAEQMMERAGKAVADAALRHFPDVRKILVFCGSGNNGGDGFVAARYLAEKGKDVNVVLLEAPAKIRTEESKNNFERLRKTGVKISEWEGKIPKCDIVLDALLGIGVSGKLKEPYRSCVAAVNKSRIPVISIDVPSGLGSDMYVKPDITVTFHDEKEGMKGRSGKIIVADIGIPAEAQECVGTGDLKVFYPLPKQDSHKGENGIVLVVGGGPYTGAPALVAFAAYRTGVDVSHLAVPEKIWQVVAGFSPNFIVSPLEGDVIAPAHVKNIVGLSKKCNAVVLGNGAGADERTIDALAECIKCIDKPMVIDADGIKALANVRYDLSGKVVVATPHAGEFLKLTGEKLPDDTEGRRQMVREWSEKLGITILLKGPVDIISDGARTKMNRIHNQGMTVGGTGDVLAGIVGALLSKGVEPFYAAALGAYINGFAGDLAFEEKWFSLLATDIIEKIPDVLKKI